MSLKHALADKWLRQRLVDARERLGMSQKDAAKLAGISERTLTRIETRQTPVDHDILTDICAAYGLTSSEAAALEVLRRKAVTVGWWDAYSDVLPEIYAEHCELEHVADGIDACSVNIVPGWLQTEEYTSFIQSLSPDLDQQERRIQLRLERQRRMLEGTKTLRVLMDEGLIHRELGNGVVKRQLAHLVQLEENGKIAARYLPFNAPTLITANFQLIRAGDRTISCVDGAKFESHREDIDIVNSFSTWFEQWWAAAMPLKLINKKG